MPAAMHVFHRRLMQEDLRNALLRRADWRFLLPDPRPSKTTCFVDGLLRSATELISQSVAGPSPVPGGDSDLAVAVDADDTTLRAAFASLRPGGSCFTEWYSPLTGGAKRIRQRLEAAGFQNVACYWCWPSPARSRPRYWLQLSAPGASRYFLLSRSPSGGAIRRFVRVLVKYMWLLCQRAGLLFPVCAVARKPASVPARCGPDPGVSSCASPFMDDLRELAQAECRESDRAASPPVFSQLVLTTGPRSISKIVTLVFREPDDRPWLAVKMPRVPESRPGLMREAATLQAIRAEYGEGLSWAPRVIFCRERFGTVIVGETALAGQLLSTMISRGNFRDFALRVTDMLAALVAPSQPKVRAAWWDRLIEPVLTDFGESFSPVIDPAMLRDTRDALMTLDALPLVCEQRDLAPWNILVTQDRQVAALDWESAELRGLPMLDLIYFLTFLSFSLNGAMCGERLRAFYRTIWDPSTFAGEVVQECVARYLARARLDRAAVAPLRLFVWLIHARSEYQRFAADVAGRPGPELLRRSMFVGLWQDEVRRAPRRSALC